MKTTICSVWSERIGIDQSELVPRGGSIKMEGRSVIDNEIEIKSKYCKGKKGFFVSKQMRFWDQLENERIFAETNAKTFYL